MRFLAALSGGVDSAVAAARLLAEGAEVVAVHLRMEGQGVAEGEGAGGAAGPVRRPAAPPAPAGAAGDAAGRPSSCCGADDARDAREVAARLGIPFYVVDAREAFGEVVRSFVAGYAGGEDPEPLPRVQRHDQVRPAPRLGPDARRATGLPPATTPVPPAAPAGAGGCSRGGIPGRTRATCSAA